MRLRPSRRNRRRILASTAGALLSLAVIPAAPAWAVPPRTCANIELDSPTPTPVVLAHACITWNDAPAGRRWTLTDQRIWNPPSAPNYDILVGMMNNVGTRTCSGHLTSDKTLECPRGVGDAGPYTAKFDVLVESVSPVPWCIYLVPRSSNVEHHSCGFD